MFHQCGEQSDRKTAEQVHNERAQGKVPRLRTMQDESAKFKTRNRSQKSADTDPQKLLHKKLLPIGRSHQLASGFPSIKGGKLHCPTENNSDLVGINTHARVGRGT